MVKTTVKAGICGFTNVVTAQSDDMQNVSVSIETDCENVRKLAQGLRVVDAYQEVGAGFDGALHTAIERLLFGLHRTLWDLQGHAGRGRAGFAGVGVRGDRESLD